MTEFNYEKARKLARQVLAELKLPEQTCKRCLALLDDSRTKGILNARTETGIISGSIYIAAILAENRLTQHTIAEAMDTSEATIRKYYVMLVKSLDLKQNSKKKRGGGSGLPPLVGVLLTFS